MQFNPLMFNFGVHVGASYHSLLIPRTQIHLSHVFKHLWLICDLFIYFTSRIWHAYQILSLNAVYHTAGFVMAYMIFGPSNWHASHMWRRRTTACVRAVRVVCCIYVGRRYHVIGKRPRWIYLKHKNDYVCSSCCRCLWCLLILFQARIFDVIKYVRKRAT